MRLSGSFRPKAPISPAIPPIPDPESLTRSIKEEALRLGFSQAGIAPVSALQNRDPELRRWIGQGLAGPLSYMQDFFRRRAELTGRFPGLRSILVLSVPYAAQGNSDGLKLPPLSGRMARYAKGKDYHRKIRKKLETLSQWIHAQTGEQTRLVATVDTSAVQERALAETAGLGFFGKNTCLIHPKQGSYFFLCALLTNLDLIPDQPLSWDCGSCTLCLDACPTQALKQPYQLDAGRCISAITIEHRGPVDDVLRPLMGNWVFGCDICQEVCPYNRRPVPEGAREALPLIEILGTRTEAQFLAKFAGTALTRAKREGLLRNAAIASGNLHDPALIPALKNAIQEDSSPIVREHATWALDQIQTAPKKHP